MSRSRLLRASMLGFGSGSGSGSAPITHGSQLISQTAGTGTNVGPNALLQSSSYPLPSSSASGPLTAVTPPSGGNWRIDSGSAQNTLRNAWTSQTAVYAYNNSSSNLGGIVPTGGMTIDGFPVPAGTWVFQFLDLSAGGFILLAGGPSVLFRGCRLRGPSISPGYFNSQSGGYTGAFGIHHCDFGSPGSALIYNNAVSVQIAQAGSFRAYRCYVSYTASAFILEIGITGTCDVIECMVEKMTLYQPQYHLNGIKLQGGNTCGRVLRNNVVYDEFDDLGNQITQTDPIGLIPTDGSFPGTGTNPDGTIGYVVDSNLVGGGSYSLYLGADGSVNNLTLTSNQITTSAYVTGGYNGSAGHIPTWGSNGNVKSANVWADGPNAGQLIAL